jgi:Ca2+-binding RTX toxin-like protein
MPQFTALQTWYEFALQQIAAESYLNVDFNKRDDVVERLKRGNNNLAPTVLVNGVQEQNQLVASGSPYATATGTTSVLPGATRMAESQASDFFDHYRIVDHKVNDPSGFSATLFKCIDPSSPFNGQYTLALRSTEFSDQIKGGDAERDSAGGADGNIAFNGFALAQIDAMEQYYQQIKNDPLKLPPGATLNVTGYSLGGHLATVFTELHASEVNQTYVFNNAGRGILTIGASIAQLLQAYQTLLVDPNAVIPGFSLPTTLGALAMRAAANASPVADVLNPNLANIYSNPRFEWAMATLGQYTSGAALQSLIGSQTIDPAANAKITAIYGMGSHNDETLTATLGIGPSNRQQVFIEDQADFYGGAGVVGPGDFQRTHSITLLADSLALMNLFQKMDPLLQQAEIEAIFAAASYKTGRSSGIISEAKADSDSLEVTLDALAKVILGPTTQALPVDESPDGFGNLNNRALFYDQLAKVAEKLDAISPGGYKISGLGSMTWVPQNVTIPWRQTSAFTRFDSVDAESIVNTAKGGDTPLALAYRYALKELNPFVVIGPGYEEIKTELQLYNPIAHQGVVTENWLRDRVAMLAAQFEANVSDHAYATIADANPIVYQEIGNTGKEKHIVAFGPPDVGHALNEDLIGRRDDSSVQRVFKVASSLPHVAVLFGSEETDALKGGALDDRFYGGAGADFLSGGVGADYLEGGSGMDVYAYSGETSILSPNTNDGNDTILDADGRGVIRYTFTGSGTSGTTSRVIGGAAIKQSETVWQSADGKFTYTKTDNDLVATINGDAGGSLTLKDFRDGDFGIRTLSLPADPEATNQIYGDLEPIDFNSPNHDYHTDEFGNLIVDPDSPAPDRDDTLFDSAGSDLIDGAGGNDVITATRGGGDRIFGGAGRDQILAGSGDDVIDGGAGDDIVQGGTGNDRIYGRDAAALNTAIVAGETATSFASQGEFFSGDDGDDVVVGAGSRDVLLGGAGKDIIVGGGGDDTLYGDASFGSATLEWTLNRSVTEDGGGVNYNRNFTHAAVNENLTDGAADAIYGGAGADWVFAGSGDDYVEGGAGEDILFGEAGSDVLIGGDDGDILIGDSGAADAAGLSGDDYLDGGAGDDTLDGGKGDDVLIGGDGADILFGGVGNDILWGGAGDDVLRGGAGKDTYVFNRGDGTETIIDEDDLDESVDTQTGNFNPNKSVLALGDGISQSNLKFRKGSLLIDAGEGDAIHFALPDGQDDPSLFPALGQIQFSDGSTMTWDDILAQGFDLDGTEDGDVIVGTGVTDRIDAKGGNDLVLGLAGDDTILGGTGNDTVFAAEGDDTVDGGEGNDTLYGEQGADALSGGAGDDQLSGGDGDDVVTGGDGNDSLDGGAGANTLDGGAGNDTLRGGNDNDLLTGGTGNDMLRGGAGDDTYMVASGDGIDVLDDIEGADTIQFGVGITPDSIAGSLINGTDGGIYLSLQYGTDDYLMVRQKDSHPGASTATFSFESGETFTQGELMARTLAAPLDFQGGSAPITLTGSRFGDSITGSADADFIDGNAGDDVLDGAEGDDTLVGGTGEDTLVGGAGDDALAGGSGADTYYLQQGMGRDVIVENPADSGVNTLQLAVGAETGFLAAETQGGDLWLHFRNTRDGVVIKDYYASGAADAWQVRNAAGVVTPLADVLGSLQGSARATDVAAAIQQFEERARTGYASSLYSAGYVLGGDGRYRREATYDTATFSTHDVTDIGLAATVQQTGDDAEFARDSEPLAQTATSYDIASGTREVQELVTAGSVFLPFGGGTRAQPGSPPNVLDLAALQSGASSVQIPNGVFVPVYSGQIASNTFSPNPAPQPVVAGYNVFAQGSTPAYNTVTVNHTQVESSASYEMQIAKITGGESGNAIDAGRGFSVVDGGAGDDVIGAQGGTSVPGGIFTTNGVPGALLYGNTGDDRLTGSRFDDAAIRVAAGRATDQCRLPGREVHGNEFEYRNSENQS